MRRVGMIGLGDMGMGMARNIIKGGFPLTGFDLRDARQVARLPWQPPELAGLDRGGGRGQEDLVDHQRQGQREGDGQGPEGETGRPAGRRWSRRHGAVRPRGRHRSPGTRARARRAVPSMW